MPTNFSIGHLAHNNDRATIREAAFGTAEVDRGFRRISMPLTVLLPFVVVLVVLALRLRGLNFVAGALSPANARWNCLWPLPVALQRSEPSACEVPPSAIPRPGVLRPQ
jgi:hypothetical protein